jgi:hypothetical protein
VVSCDFWFAGKPVCDLIDFIKYAFLLTAGRIDSQNVLSHLVKNLKMK